MKAEFKNEDAFLWPGQFVQVSLILRMQPNAVVAPAAAVQLGQKGAYVFVVGSDQTAQLRLVKVERTYAEEAVLSAGVKPGETVVVDGQNRLKDGFKVRLADVPGAGK
jgi:multidrug efflux system membrane fusion protein